jgi:hypothetical protein
MVIVAESPVSSIPLLIRIGCAGYFHLNNFSLKRINIGHQFLKSQTFPFWWRKCFDEKSSDRKKHNYKANVFLHVSFSKEYANTYLASMSTRNMSGVKGVLKRQ